MSKILEWIKVLGPIIISWPMVALLVVLLFKDPLLKLIYRFTESSGSKAELGPIKIELGSPVLPPQYREVTSRIATEKIDLSSEIGAIRDTGPEGTTVGFAIAYAIQAAVKEKTQKTVEISARGIYVLAKKYDEWPGEDYEGTSVTGGLRAVREIGAYLEADWPYSNKAIPEPEPEPLYKISSYSELKGIEEIINALRKKKVVITTVQITEDFNKTDRDGRVTVKLPLRTIGGKALSIVGYDAETAQFKFANDWGTSWGLHGFGFIKDTDLTKILKSAYTLNL
ncbi:MAG: C1 family peptidase [Desulfuromonadaceae bacterium]